MRIRRTSRFASLLLLAPAAFAASSARRPAGSETPAVPVAAEAAATAPKPQPPAGPVARASDPQPGADRCSGYTLDGIGLDMPRSEVEKLVPLAPVSEAESQLGEFRKTTFGFRARRPGRFDDLQIGFDPEGKDPVVLHLRARILVVKDDPWPSTLFELLGPPKKNRVGEWIWWDADCNATLRLTRVEPLGGGLGQPYILELKHSKPKG